MSHQTLGYTEGSGANVAIDRIAGEDFQRVKPVHGAEGQATDTSEADPLPVTITRGELLEALEALRLATNALTRSVGSSFPDVAGRLRVALDSISASLTLATVTSIGTVTTVTTVSTVTNQTNIGGLSAAPQIPALMLFNADALRNRIEVTP